MDTAILGNDNVGCLGLVLENNTLFVSPNILRKLQREQKDYIVILPITASICFYHMIHLQFTNTRF